MIPELFAMLKLAMVEIKKDHQMWMVKKTTSFKKKGKGKKKGNFKKNSKQVADVYYTTFFLYTLLDLQVHRFVGQ